MPRIIKEIGGLVILFTKVPPHSSSKLDLMAGAINTIKYHEIYLALQVFFTKIEAVQNPRYRLYRSENKSWLKIKLEI